MNKTTTPILRSRFPEYATEISIILVSLGLFTFLKLTEEVINGETGGFDRRILLWFRDDIDLGSPIGPAWLEVVVRDITALGGFLVLGLLCSFVVGYLWLRRHRHMAVYVAVSVTAGIMLNTLLKELITRPRPDIISHGTGAALSSFPSGHTMMSTVVFLTLGALLSMTSDDRRTKIYILFWSIFLPLLVGVSRLYLGVHWPTDIIAGWIAGATWALICLLFSQLFIKRTTQGVN